MNLPVRSSASALLGCFLCILLSPVVIGFYTFTVFFDALSEELGWGRGILGLAITVGTVTIAAASPVVGRLADRGGARLLVVRATLALILIVALMPCLCKTLVGLYIAMAVIGVLAACYMVAIPRIISSWFEARRGLALGFAMSGAGLGAALIAPLTAAIIATTGWQAAYFALAVIVSLIALPGAFFLVHEAPGTPAASAGGLASERPGRINAQLVLLSGAFLLIGAGLHGVLIHFSPMLTGRGIEARTAAGFFAAASIAMFIGRIGCGFLLDRLPANRVGAVLMITAAGGILLLDNANSSAAIFLGAVLFGLGVSAELDLISYIVSRLYPIEHFSRSFALAYSAFMIGTSIGPPLLGGLYDYAGNYALGTAVAAALTAVSALVLVSMRPTPLSRTIKAVV